jgi:hypothetical protein
MDNSARFMLRLPSRLNDFLGEEAERRGITQSEIVRCLVSAAKADPDLLTALLAGERIAHLPDGIVSRNLNNLSAMADEAEALAAAARMLVKALGKNPKREAVVRKIIELARTRVPA